MHIFTFTSLLSTFLYGLLVDSRLLFIQLFIIALYFVGSYMNNHGRTSVRKKIAMSSWSAPQDPSCYGTMEFDCEIIDDYIKTFNQKNPKANISYTHFFMKVLGNSFIKSPQANGTIAFGQFVPFDSVNINTLVDIDGKNLAGVTVENCDKLSLKEIRTKTNEKVKKIKNKSDEQLKDQMKIAKMLPAPLMSLLLQFSSFVSYYLGMGLRSVKIKKYQFGNVIVTNVSKMEVYDTFAPLVNFTNAIIIAVICKPKDKVVVNDKREMVIKKMMNLNVTFDHRYADAMTVQETIKEIYKLCANPEKLGWE